MTLKESHLSQEIHEQPEVLNRLLTQALDVIQQLAAAIKQRQVTHVIIAGRGTRDNAGRYDHYLLGAVNRLTVALATPSLLRWNSQVYISRPTSTAATETQFIGNVARP